MGRLTYTKAKSLQKAGLYGDGGTLFLKVQVRNGRVTKSWVQRVTVRGRRRDIGLGAFPLVSLAEARELAFDIRRLARRGEDPKPRAVPTFTFYPAAVDLCQERFEELKCAIPFKAEKPPNAPATRRAPNQWYCRVDEAAWATVNRI